MFNIHKKLLILLCLYLVNQQLNAQTPGRLPSQVRMPGVVQPHLPNRILPNLHDYNWYMAELRKRGIQPRQLANATSKSVTTVNVNRLSINRYQSKEAFRQQLLQRYPILQQSFSRAASLSSGRQASLLSSGKPLVASQRPSASHIEYALKALEKARQARAEANP